jgi:hypothetical protein
VQLDLATVLVQWAAGGLLFCWVTTRRREVGLGYGWLLRAVFGALAVSGLAAGLGDGGAGATVRGVGAAAMAVLAAAALGTSIARRGAGVRGQRERRAARTRRVRAMAGRPAAGAAGDDPVVGTAPEFDPRIDLAAALAGLVAVAGAASFVGGPYALAAYRLGAGALFLGAVTDAMLLGHWYLVQPGLDRAPIRQLVKLTAVLWPLEVAAYLVPRGMIGVLDGSIDDGYGGLIGWMWVVAVITTIALLGVTWLALKERYYSAVMAATGLLYLAILTGFGIDLLPRAVLA